MHVAGSRYVYELYYDKEAISKQLYEWLLKNGYADANLIAKWKKQGYEKVGTHLLSTLYWTNQAPNLVVLPTLHTDEGNELQLHLHLSSAQGTVEGGPDYRMCQLRLSRVLF